MQAITYPALITEPEAGAFLVTFPDVPEAITQGNTLAEAQDNAQDALAAALEGYLEFGRAFPARVALDAATARAGEVYCEVAVDPILAARNLLAVAMQAQGLTKVGLAARLGKDEKVVRRIIAGRNASLDLTLAALRAVGVRPALAT
jgi:antitoxin HicB